MSFHKKKIAVFKHCLSCNYKCEQKAKDLKICLKDENIISLDEIFDEQFKDNVKFHILWFLDDEKCTLALTKAKDLSKAVDKIIAEIKTSIEKIKGDKMEQEKYKCKWCGENLEFDDIFISKEGWAYCCKCETVLCDLSIQDKNHFLIKNIDKIPCSSEFKKKIKASIDN